jgi:hypothetical protein
VLLHRDSKACCVATCVVFAPVQAWLCWEMDWQQQRCFDAQAEDARKTGRQILQGRHAKRLDK